MSSLALFISTSVLLILAPGPDILFVLAQGMNNGRKAGIMTALGLSLGNVVHVIAAILGVAIIFKTSPVAFNAVKVLGVLYLFFLAYKAFKHRNDHLSLRSGVKRSAFRMFSKGFIMNVLNPKVAVFFLAYFPQFVVESEWSPTVQMAALGTIFIVLVILIFGSIGIFAGYVGSWLKRSPHYSTYMNIITEIVFVGLGLKLAFLQQ